MLETLGMIAERLWSMSIQACVLILVILIFRQLLRNCKKVYSYFLWMLVLVRLLCPVMIESNWSMQPDFVSENLKEVTEVSTVVQNNNVNQIQDTFDVATDDMIIEKENNSYETQKPTALSMKEVLQVSYFVGLLGFAIYFFAQYCSMKKKVAFAIRERGNVWLCEQITSPFVMGIVKPKIYLPYGIEAEEKKHILRHERAHIKHYDPFVRMLGTLAIILHWWNPLVWYAIHKMNQDMEMFCDETALRNATLAERKEYSKSLLQFSMKQSGIAVPYLLANQILKCE